MIINHNGYLIWKAASDGKDEKARALNRKIVTTLMIICMGISALFFLLKIDGIIQTKSESILYTFINKYILIDTTVLLIFIAILHRLQKKPKRYAFIKNPYGEMYIIDYNTPFLANNPYQASMNDIGTTQQFDPIFLNKNKSAEQIDIINRMKLFELLAEKNMIMPYGKKILRVNYIKDNESFCFASLTVTDGKYPPRNLAICLHNTYPDLNVLVANLKAMK